MKKLLPATRLKLTSETLRLLDTHHLGHVVGGDPITTRDLPCTIGTDSRATCVKTDTETKAAGGCV